MLILSMIVSLYSIQVQYVQFHECHSFFFSLMNIRTRSPVVQRLVELM